MKRTLWVVSGGAEAVPGIQQAKALGLHVVCSDANPEAPGCQYADDVIEASTYDGPLTAQLAAAYHAKHPVHGVIAMCADVPLTVAHVADVLHLPGLPLDVAAVAADKVLQKERLRAAGVPTAWGQLVHSPGEARRLMLQRPAARFVLKPADSRGARGVFQVAPKHDDVGVYWGAAREASPSHRVVLEEWLDGPQFSTEGYLSEGTGIRALPGLLDRNYARLAEFAPHVIEDGATQPTTLSRVERQQLAALHFQAASALGFHGFSKGDLVWTPTGPAVIEMAARLSGGWMSTFQVPLATGVDLIGAAIAHALGDPLNPTDLAPRATITPVAQRFFFPRPGRVVDIHLPRGRLPGVLKLVLPSLGQQLTATTSHPARAGFVVTVGETRADAVARAEAVVEQVQIETSPS